MGRRSDSDFFKYIGRRIDSARALFVVTLRDDELGLDHPLRRVLGDLPATITRRVALAPLSRGAVEKLARAAGRDAGALHRLTGGNPLDVSELLAELGKTVPASVRDVVLARFGRLSPAARSVVELVATEPGRLERAVVHAVSRVADQAVRDASSSGVLEPKRTDWFSFREVIEGQRLGDSMGPRNAAAQVVRVCEMRALFTTASRAKYTTRSEPVGTTTSPRSRRARRRKRHDSVRIAKRRLCTGVHSRRATASTRRSARRCSRQRHRVKNRGTAGGDRDRHEGNISACRR